MKETARRTASEPAVRLRQSGEVHCSDPWLLLAPRPISEGPFPFISCHSASSLMLCSLLLGKQSPTSRCSATLLSLWQAWICIHLIQSHAASDLDNVLVEVPAMDTRISAQMQARRQICKHARMHTEATEQELPLHCLALRAPVGHGLQPPGCPPLTHRLKACKGECLQDHLAVPYLAPPTLPHRQSSQRWMYSSIHLVVPTLGVPTLPHRQSLQR